MGGLGLKGRKGVLLMQIARLEEALIERDKVIAKLQQAIQKSSTMVVEKKSPLYKKEKNEFG